MDAIYHNMLQTYIPQGNQRPSVHKRSELKKHYQEIVEKSKMTPLYLLDFSKDKQEYTMNVKEMALKCKDVFQKLSAVGANSPFYRKEAVSANEEAVKAEIITDDYSNLPGQLRIRIDQTAGPQINYGKALYAKGRALTPDTYQFEGKIDGKRYAFSLIVRENSRNLDVETQLARYLTNAGVGLEAHVERDHRGDMIQMVIQSRGTGDNGEPIFQFQDVGDNKRTGIVEALELNEVGTSPQNAKFTLNGEKKESLNNQYTINDCVQLHLQETTENEIPIYYQVDAGASMDEIDRGIASYNEMVRQSKFYSERSGQYSKLSSELSHLVRNYESELEAVGIHMEDNQELSIDPSLAYQAISEGEMQKVFSGESQWLSRMLFKTNQIATDPIEYIDKKVVTYPDYSRQGTPFTYMTSMYSGILFNATC